MRRTVRRWGLRVAPLVGLLIWATLPIAGQSGAKNGEWTTYGADLANTRYSPLDQISAGNFNKLEIAWRFKTESLGPRPEFNFESNAVDGAWRRLLDRRHPPGGGRPRRGDRRADVDAQRARRGARFGGASPALGTRPLGTGPMGARNGFSTSRPATGSSRLMQKPAFRSRASARMASSI